MESLEDTTATTVQQCVEHLRFWVETKAKFHGRTDQEFLLIFLKGCKFDMEKAKKKMNMYYESRKKIPQWWINRQLEEFIAVNQNKPSIILIDRELNLPSVAVSILSNNDSKLFDAYIKQHSIIMELAIRRANCQDNGIIWMADAKNTPLWLIMKALNPSFVFKIIKSFYLAIPIRLKAIHIFNSPAISQVAWKIVRPMLTEKMRKRIYFHDSDLYMAKDHVDNRLLPLEFGGSNGTLQEHEDALDEEMRVFYDYLVDDEKYGF